MQVQNLIPGTHDFLINGFLNGYIHETNKLRYKHK